jgi:hypothetical protein
MDQMADEFGDRWVRQHSNGYGGVQNRLDKKKFNVRKVVKRVNTDMDEFVAYNTDIGNINFDNVFMGNGKRFG